MLLEQRLDLGELPDEVLARIACAQEREDAVTSTVPSERCGQAERRVVLGLQPQLEHELRPALDRPLVEVKAQLPRSRGAACERTETVVHPARQLSLQCWIARVRRQR